MHKTFGPAHIKAVADDGSFEGYASLFGVPDSINDVVVKGAFAGSLDARPPMQIRMLREHDPRVIVGVWRDITEDDKGLRVKGQLLLDVPAAQETHTLMKAGVLDGLSIGFNTIKAQNNETGQRELQEVDLWEISVVTFPMQDIARVTAVKADDLRSRTDLKSALLDAGFSDSVASHVAAGWSPPHHAADSVASLYRGLSDIIGGQS